MTLFVIMIVFILIVSGLIRNADEGARKIRKVERKLDGFRSGTNGMGPM